MYLVPSIFITKCAIIFGKFSFIEALQGIY